MVDRRNEQRIQEKARLYCEAILRYDLSLCHYVYNFTLHQEYTIDDGKGGKIHVNVRTLETVQRISC